MKNSLLLAAAAGLVFGASCSRQPATAGSPALPAGYVLEKDLPAGELAGLTEAQKHELLQAMNELPDECGPGASTYAACRAKSPDRPRAARAFAEAKRLAGMGRESEEIAAAVARMPTAVTAPMPAVRIRGDAPVEPEKIHVHPGAEGNH